MGDVGYKLMALHRTSPESAHASRPKSSNRVLLPRRAILGCNSAVMLYCTLAVE